jgi:DNA (cytosine-5)-methyltransferase 1
MMNRAPTVVSLFAGVGGLDLGFVQAGFEILWANELDTDAAQSHRLNFEQEVDSRDIRIVPSNEIPESDAIIGGFPCQGFSVANMKRSPTDGRNVLYLEFVRAIKDKQPRIFVAENVKGILTLGKGKLFEQIKNDFASAGYTVKHHLFNAANYGVPQRRERVFLIGVRSDLAGLDFAFPPEPTHHDQRKPSLIRLEPWVSVSTALEQLPPPGDYPEFSHHLPSQYKLEFSRYLGHRALDPDLPSPTVTGRGDDKGGVVALPHPNRQRRMTPRELAVIQGFPVEFKFSGTKTSVYRQIANAVPPPLAYKIASTLLPLVTTKGSLQEDGHWSGVPKTSNQVSHA